MEARPRILEIMVISGENLCIDRNPVKENAYVVVRAESLKWCTTKMAKQLGESSSSLLSWNEKLLLDIPLHARSVTFEVHCKTSKGAVRNIGVARIAISDFLGGKVSESSIQMLSYRLRDWDGRRNGVIHFSVKAKLPEEDPSCEAKMVPAKGMPVTCGGFEGKIMGFQVDETNSNGVVVGIPVWWSYPSNV